MKKLTTCIVLTIALMTFNSRQSMASINSTSDGVPLEQTEEVRLLVARMNEIKAMDKRSLTASEKKELRKEVRAAKRQVNSSGGGVYLSVGAIILIIILLIILL